MSTHRITSIAAVALAVAAASAPAASAMPQDLRNADNRVPDAPPNVTRGIYEPIPADQQPHYPTPAEEPQDFRNPDTRDYAEGRGTYNSPEVVVVDAPRPVAQPTAGGVDWEDVGIGAGGVLSVVLIGAGGALAIAHRRSARRLAS
jgi:hypothetical protein